VFLVRQHLVDTLEEVDNIVVEEEDQEQSLLVAEGEVVVDPFHLKYSSAYDESDQ
jgi:hypothetical protein